jgi:hypothetical protein
MSGSYNNGNNQVKDSAGLAATPAVVQTTGGIDRHGRILFSMVGAADKGLIRADRFHLLQQLPYTPGVTPQGDTALLQSGQLWEGSQPLVKPQAISRGQSIVAAFKTGASADKSVEPSGAAWFRIYHPSSKNVT